MMRQSRQIPIKKFDMNNILVDAIILIIGMRRSGKSVLLDDICYHVHDKVDTCIAMAPTLDTTENWEKSIPYTNIYEDYYESVLEAIVKIARWLKRKKKRRRIAILLDDCNFDKNILKSKIMRYIHMNGRHDDLLYINLTQYCMDYTAGIRDQVDYVFAFHDPIPANKMKLWKYFFGIFDTYQDFSKVFDELTKDNSCMVLDKTKKSSDIVDSIYWYRADINVPQFMMGNRDSWKLNWMHRLTEEEEKKETKKKKKENNGDKNTIEKIKNDIIGGKKQHKNDNLIIEKRDINGLALSPIDISIPNVNVTTSSKKN